MTTTHKNKYVREGYIVLDSWFSEDWNPIRTGLKGRPEVYPENFIEFCSRLRFIQQLTFRELEGILLALKNYLNLPKVANFTTLWRRIVKNAKVKQYNFTNKKYKYLILDSSGMSQVKRSGYMAYKWQTRRNFTKIHFGINENHEIIFFDVTQEKGGGDAKIALKNLKQLKVLPKKLFGDGGYDRIELFDFCYKNQIQTAIPIRKNAKPKLLAEPLRYKEFKLQQIDFNLWKELSNYKIRTAVERSFSAFKRRFGDACRSLKYELQSVFRMVQCFVWLQNIIGGEHLCN